MDPALQDVATAVAILAVLFLALEIGFRYGVHTERRREAAGGAAGGQVGAIQGAVLGLLGLLLGFSFAAAGARFLERQDLITTEANAIGTAYLRAELLDDAHRGALRLALKRYTAHRIEVGTRLRGGISDSDAAQVEAMQGEMWAAACGGVKLRPEVGLLVLPPVNDVIDLHSTRMAAAHKRLPGLVLGLLIGSAILSIADIGYGSGLTGRRRLPLTLPLTLIVASALAITIDLDHPRAGLLRLNDAPLEALRFDDAPAAAPHL